MIAVMNVFFFSLFFFFNDTATTEIYTLSLHDALPIRPTVRARPPPGRVCCSAMSAPWVDEFVYPSKHRCGGSRTRGRAGAAPGRRPGRDRRDQPAGSTRRRAEARPRPDQTTSAAPTAPAAPARAAAASTAVPVAARPADGRVARAPGSPAVAAVVRGPGTGPGAEPGAEPGPAPGTE